jgi:hypothetical protein
MQGRLNWEEAFVDATFLAVKKAGMGVGRTKYGQGTKGIAVGRGKCSSKWLFVWSWHCAFHGHDATRPTLESCCSKVLRCTPMAIIYSIKLAGSLDGQRRYS